MINHNKVFAVIPARSGSKGLPGKNQRPIVGKPLIAWSIAAAQRSRYIDRIVVSTDGPQIAEIAKTMGIHVPSLRPKDLAEDSSTTAEVINHELSVLQDQIGSEDLIVLLEPTSPLRDSSDIDKAIEKLVATEGAEAIVGVAENTSGHPAFCVELNEEYLFRPGGFPVLRRQDIKPSYYYEGSLYISKVGSWISRQTFYHEHALGMLFPKWKASVVDDEVDFIIAERLLQLREDGFFEESSE